MLNDDPTWDDAYWDDRRWLTAVESWLCDDDADDIETFLLQHPDMRERFAALESDRVQLETFYARLDVPDPPILDLRDPLTAASGHPRRVSLTLMPFLLSMILFVSILGALAAGRAVSLRVASIEARALDRCTENDIPWPRSVEDWDECSERFGASAWAVLRERSLDRPSNSEWNDLEFRAESLRPIDPFGNEYVRLPDGRAYSTGPNGWDEGGAGDDVVGNRLPRSEE